MVESQEIFRRILSGWRVGSPSHSFRRPRGLTPQLDSLEGRVVLSHLGLHGHRASSRTVEAHVNKINEAESSTTKSTGMDTTSPTTSAHRSRHDESTTRDAQLTTDLQKLQTDLHSAMSGSSVTDAQRLALSSDFHGIVKSGVTIDKMALSTSANNLLMALADGTYASNADTAASIKASFTAAFSATSINQTKIDQAYTDIVTVATNVNLSTEELTTLAADRSAIQTDLTRLGIITANGHGHAPAQFSNLDLILAPGFGRGLGRHDGRF